MLFMAEMEVRLPPDMPAEQADELKAREREYSQALQRDGRWPHLWRVAGRYANVSVLDVGSIDELHELLSGLPLFAYLDIRVTRWRAIPTPSPEEETMSDRANLLISDILRRIHEAIVEHDISYEEYQAAKQWLTDVGEAGEWPLFGDVYIEHVVEEQAFGNRAGSQGTILGPFHVPDAPLLDAPFELPHRADEPGDRTHVSGRVTDADGKPLADANLDVWQADAEGRYSGFMPGPPAGNLRGQVRSDADGRYEFITMIPGPYTIPLDGPTGKMTAAAGWSPWRPAHIHLIVSAEGYEPLVTQLFIDTSDYLDSDVASAVKPELIVHPEPKGDGELALIYDFALAPARTAAMA